MARRTTAKPADAPAPETPPQANEWDNPPTGDEHGRDNPEPDDADDEDQDEGEDDEAGDAPDTDAEADVAALSTVDHDAPASDPQPIYQQDTFDGGSEGLAIGQVLTERQRSGLDPVDAARHVAQASDREPLTNAQTDHEAVGGLDPVSGTPNPGITAATRHSAPGIQGATDMSGNAPRPDPVAGNLSAAAGAAMKRLQDVSNKAKAQNKGRGQGWANLQEIGASKATMDALVLAGHIDQNTRPGGEFSPDTGTVYRVKGHDD